MEEPLNLAEQAIRFDSLSAATGEAELTGSNLGEFQIESNPIFKLSINNISSSLKHDNV